MVMGWGYKVAMLVCALTAVTVPVRAGEPVNIDNFIRAETDFYMKSAVGMGCFGKLCHSRGPIPVDQQTVIRSNLDTPYSIGVFDLSAPVTITMPDAGKRFQSLLVLSEDHYIKHVSYGPGPVTLTQDMIGTRYVYVMVRTFMDPNDAKDRQAAAVLQDSIGVSQANPGTFEVPDWDQDQRMAVRTALLAGARYMPDAKNAFGDEGMVDPVRRLFATAGGWGGNAEKDAIYLNQTVPNQDGKQAYTLTLGKVPVDGFWSVTVYNAKGFYEDPISAVSVNNVTAKPSKDGTTTIRFGGDPKAANFINIMPGWNYIARLYRPRGEILDGSWKLPAAVPAN
jgi:hypothetical protein